MKKNCFNIIVKSVVLGRELQGPIGYRLGDHRWPMMKNIGKLYFISYII